MASRADLDVHTDRTNARAHIIALQLQMGRLQDRVTDSAAQYNKLTEEQVVSTALRAGFIHECLAVGRERLTELQSIQGKLTDAMTGQGPAHHAVKRGGQGAGGVVDMPFGLGPTPRPMAALVVEHISQIVVQQHASICNLEDVLEGPENSSFFSYFRGQLARAQQGFPHPERPPLPKHGNGTSGQLGSSDRNPTSIHIAHFIEFIPREVVSVMQPGFELPTGYDLTLIPPHLVGGGAPMFGSAPRVFDFPVLLNPETLWPLYVARQQTFEQTFEQALVLAKDGDVIFLAPGRYNLPETSACVILSNVRIVGMGKKQADVVIYNDADDDSFIECYGDDVQMENLTLLQLGGYEGIVQVMAGATTMIDCTLQCSGGGAWVKGKGRLSMYGCNVVGATSSAVQVEAGGHLEVVDSVISQCGRGDAIVPRDLGAVEIQVRLRPICAMLPCFVPVLTVEDLLGLCLLYFRQLDGTAATATTCGTASASSAHAAGCTAADTNGICHTNGSVPLQTASGSEVCGTADCTSEGGTTDSIAGGVWPAATRGSYSDPSQFDVPTHQADLLHGASTATAGADDGPSCSGVPTQGSDSSFASSSLKPPLAPLPPDWQALLVKALSQLEPPATVVIGPGTKISNNKGFAISIVKPRALAMMQEPLHSKQTTASSSNRGGGGKEAAVGGAQTSAQTAMDGTRLYIHTGVVLSGNTRGPMGVVDAEYLELEGDQLTSQQLRDGFASKSFDWTPARTAFSQYSTTGGPATMSTRDKLSSLLSSPPPSLPPGRGALPTAPGGTLLRQFVCLGYKNAASKAGASSNRERTQRRAMANNFPVVLEKGDGGGSSGDSTSEYSSYSDEDEDGGAGSLAGSGGHRATSQSPAHAQGHPLDGDQMHKLYSLLDDRTAQVLQPLQSGMGHTHPSCINGVAGIRGSIAEERGSWPEASSTGATNGPSSSFRSSAATEEGAAGGEGEGAAGGEDEGEAGDKACWECWRPKAKLKRCISCQKARYCSVRCQHAHWEAHKEECSLWTKKKADEERTGDIYF
eukprot:gene22286-29364_t